MIIIDGQRLPKDAGRIRTISPCQPENSFLQEEEDDDDEDEMIEDSDHYINVVKLNHPVDVPASTIRKMSRAATSLTGMFIQSISESSMPLEVLNEDESSGRSMPLDVIEAERASESPMPLEVLNEEDSSERLMPLDVFDAEDISKSSMQLEVLKPDINDSSNESAEFPHLQDYEDCSDSSPDLITEENSLENYSISISPTGINSEACADKGSSTFFSQLLDLQSSNKQFRQLLVSQTDRYHSRKTVEEFIRHLDVCLK